MPYTKISRAFFLTRYHTGRTLHRTLPWIHHCQFFFPHWELRWRTVLSNDNSLTKIKLSWTSCPYIAQRRATTKFPRHMENVINSVLLCLITLAWKMKVNTKLRYMLYLCKNIRQWPGYFSNLDLKMKSSRFTISHCVSTAGGKPVSYLQVLSGSST